jgi:hypothetical protein
MCRQKLRNEVPAARNLALSCHPRLIPPCSLLPHIKTCERTRRGAMRRDLDHGDLICLLRRTNRLPDCGARADWSTTVWRLVNSFGGCQSNKHRKAAIVFATVKGDPACAPILTTEAYASRANLGWCGVSQRTKFRVV